MLESWTHLDVVPGAPCVFCDKPPNTQAKVWISGGGGSEKYLYAPACEDCKQRYSRFNRRWIAATLGAGQLLAPLVALPAGWYAEMAWHEALLANFGIGLAFVIPVGLLYRVVSEATYIGRAKAWQAKWVRRG